jgi:hypothetical protein
MIILSEMMEKNEQIGIWQQLKTKGLKVAKLKTLKFQRYPMIDKYNGYLNISSPPTPSDFHGFPARSPAHLIIIWFLSSGGFITIYIIYAQRQLRVHGMYDGF